MIRQTYQRKGANMRFMQIAMASLVLVQACMSAASAADAEVDGRRLYASCAACHGTDGRPEAKGALPPLAGQSREVLIASMQAFRSGQRKATIMHQIAKGYDDAQIALIATFLSTREKP